jgi:hypothetical protein
MAINSIGQSFGDYMTRFGDKVFGIDRKQEQIDQQRKLMGLEMEGNKAMMEHSRKLQMQTWHDTNYSAQRAEMEKAGLNPALMYGMSGGGGTTTGSPSGSVTGGRASDEASMKALSIQQQGMALQNAKLSAEIKVLESQAEKNKADAGLSGAKTDTEEKQRNYLIGKLREEGVYYWLQNEINELKLDGTSTEVEVIKNMFLNRVIGKNSDSWAQKEITNALLKTVAETGKLDADKLLSSERAKSIWKELIIAQQNADSNTVKAKASELAVNWGTGEYKNWKTWVDLGANALKTITSIIK